MCHLEPQNIMATGRAGFIGSTFIHHHLRFDAKAAAFYMHGLTGIGSLFGLAVCADGGQYGDIEGVAAGGSVKEGDLNNSQVATAIHFAAASLVVQLVSSLGLVVNLSIAGDFRCLGTTRSVWGSGLGLRRFLRVSTDEVGGTLAAPVFGTSGPNWALSYHLSREPVKPLGGKEWLGTVNKNTYANGLFRTAAIMTQK